MGRIQDLPKEGADHGEHGARAYNEGLESEPPAGSRGTAPAGGQRGKAHLNDKDLNETI